MNIETTENNEREIKVNFGNREEIVDEISGNSSMARENENIYMCSICDISFESQVQVQHNLHFSIFEICLNFSF